MKFTLLSMCTHTWHNNHTHKLNSKVMDEFTVESIVRGHHIYKTIWTPYIGEKLSFLLANISHRPANVPFSTTHILSYRARPFIATPISMSVYLDMGVYFLRCSYRMGVYSGMGVYSSRAFNQANTVCNVGFIICCLSNDTLV